MQTHEAERLRKAWGNKPCAHPSLAKEYYRDVSTGDYVCDTCGKEFSEQEVWQRRRERNAERQAHEHDE